MAINRRITLTGIRSTENSIGPAGNHLRWAFPAELGFPAKGFVVYRRPSGGFKSAHCLNLTKEKVPTNSVVTPGSTLEGVSFHYPDTVQIRGNSTNLTVQPLSSELLELRFTQPTVYVRIAIAGSSGTVTLRAYAGAELVATSSALTAAGGVMEVFAPNITRVTLPLQFRTLSAVCNLTMDGACQDKEWGQPIAELPLLASVDEGLARLEVKLRNRYTTDRTHAVQRYRPGLRALIDWLDLLQDPASYADPGILPSELQLPSPDPDSPLKSIRPQSILLLAALDPNIARFLSLYWVDQYEAGNGAKRGVSYDYKVAGTWNKQEVGCGMIFGLGAQDAKLPVCAEPLEGNQLPGLRWRGRDPLGRVGLRWPRPKEGQGAVQPVLFDLWRESGAGRKEFLTDKRPVLVASKAWTQDSTALFVDTNVALGRQQYQLQAVDLFGQVGPAIESEAIVVEDLEAPPPPVRLHTILTQPGYPWRRPEQLARVNEPATLRLQFEYGDSQHRQAPDAKTFHVYWRAESMFVSQSVTGQRVSSDTFDDGIMAHRVRATTGTALDLAAFVGGKLSREGTAGRAFPATERHHYQVARRLTSNELQLAPSHNQFVDDDYRLTSDPRLRSNWTKLDLDVPVRQPLQGIVRAVETFRATATGVRTVMPNPDALAMLPSGRRPAPFADATPIVEVELDRRLLEADIVAEGTLETGGRTYRILYSTSDTDAPARVGLPADATVSTGAALVLKSASGAARLVQSLTIQGSVPDEIATVPGGEIAFDVVRNGETVTYVARVVSDIERDTNAFHVLVRLSPAARTALVPSTTRGRYYAPYRVGLGVTLSATTVGTAAANTITLPMPAGQSSQNAYLAVATEDDRDKEGPLSSPAQAVAVWPPPTGAPARPYPCGYDVTAATGYAAPPDREGRATLCLAWDVGTLSTPEGLRYEVARALDNTILATHRRNWLLGGSPLQAASPLSGTLSGVTFEEARGLYRAEMTVNLGGSDSAAFRGGRLSRNGRFFQITTVVAGNSGSLQLMLRPMGANAPTNGAATIETPPDYEAVRDDVVALRQLAADNPDAWALVTGMPITATQFRDEIPGIGRNRFFYRVRAADAAENRSAWSEVSAPFSQADTTAPAAPRQLQTFSSDRSVRLIWAADPSAELTCRVKRTSAIEANSPATPSTLLGTTNSHRPLRVHRGKLQLALPSAPSATPIVTRVGDPNAASLCVTNADLTSMTGRQIQHVNPLVTDGTPIRVVFRRAAEILTVDRRPGTEEQLVVSGGTVDLSFGFSVQSIVGVFLHQAYRNGEAGPLQNNWFGSGATFANLTVSGLPVDLAEGTEVAVLARDAAGQDRVIQYAPGTTEPLTVQAGSIALDLNLSSATLEDIVVAAGSKPASAYLKIPTRFALNARTGLAQFDDLNPLAGEGTPVQVEWTDSSGAAHLETTVFGEFEFEDTTARGGRQYRYEVTTARRVSLNPTKTIEVISAPVAIDRISCSESNAPEIASIDAAWLTAADAMARNAGEARSARIVVATTARGSVMISRLGPGGGIEGTSSWTEPSAFDAQTDSFRFELREQSDPTRPTQYTVRLMSFNGRDTWSAPFAPRFAP